MKKRNELKMEKDIFNSIKSLSEGLYYMSETDAEILPFAAGKVSVLNKETFARQLGIKDESQIEERDFDAFFKRLTEIKDWFGDEEKATAERFQKLRDFLEQNLRSLKVFRVGRIEIDIYVLGLDDEGRIFGIKTQAVET